MTISLEVAFAKETVRTFVREHSVDLHKKTIINSDQGRHYISIVFIRNLKGQWHKIELMPKCGDCWGNALQASSFRHIKDHLMEQIAGEKALKKKENFDAEKNLLRINLAKNKVRGL